MKASIAFAMFSAALATCAPSAYAGQGDHVAVVDSNAEVVLTYSGSSASFANLLYLAQPYESDLIFSNARASNPSVSLGQFLADTLLVFRMNSNGSENWFTGPASSNDDAFAHAFITELGDNVVQVAFEDLRDGGDQNFDDLVFTVSNARAVAAVPEPETYALMLAGLALVAWGGRRRIDRLRWV